MNHINSFIDNNIDAVLSDYTGDSVLITQNAIYKGPEEIKPFFVHFISHFPKKWSTFKLDKLVSNDYLVFITWHAITPTVEVPLGTDTFIIKDGKIHSQTFAGQLNFLR